MFGWSFKINWQYITKIVKYSCELCEKGFCQKSHCNFYNRRKTLCENNPNKIRALTDKAVEEKLQELNKNFLLKWIDQLIVVLIIIKNFIITELFLIMS